jgi:hypothetical protein
MFFDKTQLEVLCEVIAPATIMGIDAFVQTGDAQPQSTFSL